MDMTAMAMAAVTAPMANQAAVMNGTAGTETATVDFASLLASMNGTDATATDMQSYLGLNFQDIQNSMLLNSMGSLMQNNKPVVTDPELAALLNQMGKLDTMDEAALEQLMEQLKDRLRQLSEENGAAAAGQQAVAMFANMMPELTGQQPSSDAIQALSTDGGSALLQMMLTGNTGDILQMMQSLPTETAASQQLSDMNNLFSSLEGSNDNTALYALATAQANANASKVGQQSGTLAGAQVQTEMAPIAQTPANTFEAAVRTAKQQLSDHLAIGEGEEAEPAPKAELDIDTLQQRVDAGTYLTGTALQQPQTVTPTETPLPVAQLAQPIEAALKAGEETLSVKLSPEDLGEVTIQLTKSAEGMKLSIIAQNPETQALLANQVEMLKVAMKPLDVQVENIYSQQQYELLNQQQQQQNRQQNQPMHGAAYYGDEPLGTAEETLRPAKPSLSSALDTYI